MKRIIEFLKTKKTMRFAYLSTIVCFTAYVFSIPTFSGKRPLNIISYFLIGVLTILIAYHFLIGFRISFKKRLLILPIFIIIAFIGTLLFSNQYRSWFTLVLLTITCFLFYCSFGIINNNRLVIRCINIAFSAFSLVFIAYYFKDIVHLNIVNGSDRLGSAFDNVNHIGAYMNFGIMIGMYNLIFPRKWYDFLSIISILLFIFVGFLTGSRTFLISFFLAFLALFFIRLKNHKIIYLVVVGCLAGAFVLFINMPFASYLKTQVSRMIYTLFGIGDSAVADESTITRLLFQKNGLFLAGKQLLFGYGSGGFAIYSNIGTYTHGNFSEVLADFGIFGTIMFYLLILLPFICFFYSKKEDKYLILPICLNYAVLSFLSVYYYNKEWFLAIALIIFMTDDVRFKKIFTEAKQNIELQQSKYMEIGL